MGNDKDREIIYKLLLQETRTNAGKIILIYCQ